MSMKIYMINSTKVVGTNPSSIELICQDLNWCWHLFAATYSVYIAQGVRDHVSIGFAFQDSEKSLN